MDRFTFTQARIKALPIPGKGRSEYHDTEIKKLVCRVSSTGIKTYSIIKRVDGVRHRVTIGQASEVTVVDARKKALKALASTEAPIKLRVVNLTLLECLDHYIKHRHPKNGHQLKENTVKGYYSVLNLHFKDWGVANKITRAMIANRFKSITATSPSSANAAARVLRLVLNHAKKIGAVSEVASDVLKDDKLWNTTKRKKRSVQTTDLKAWSNAVDNLSSQRAKSYLMLLLYTGLRAGEALSLQWSDIKKDRLTVRDTKNHEDHTLPIPEQLKSYIDAMRPVTGHLKWVFTSESVDKPMGIPKKQIARVVQLTDLEFSSHDLRRTFASIAEQIGVPFSIIKKLLNHKEDMSNVTEGYFVTEFEVLVSSMAKIATFIHDKITGNGNVVRLYG